MKSSAVFACSKSLAGSSSLGLPGEARWLHSVRKCEDSKGSVLRLDGGEGGGEAFAADRARFVVGGLVDAEAGNVAYYLVGYWFANGR